MRIAFFQQNIVWESPSANFDKVERMMSSLESPVDIIVLPETFSTGFSDNMAHLADTPDGATLQFARSVARRFDALFVGSWTVLDADGSVYNRLHWVAPDGSFGFYDKAHTFRMSSEASQLGRGTRRAVFEWRGWRVKPAVCYDLRFPKWLRNSVIDDCGPDGTPTLDYDLLIVCANWPASRHEAWSTLLKARAIENLSYVVGVNRVGEDGVGIPYSGNSAAVDFKGQVVAQCAHGSEMVRVVSLDRDELSHFRSHWPFFLDFD